MTADFVRDVSPPYPIFTDPGLKTYHALGLRHGLGLKLLTVRRAMEAYKAGFRQTRTRGDPLQQGGVVVIDQSDQIKWLHADDSPGNHAPMEQLRAAVASL